MNSAGQNYAAGAGDYLTQAANARAAGAVGIGNAASGALANIANIYGMRQQQYASPGGGYGNAANLNAGYANQGSVNWGAYDAAGTPGYAGPYGGGSY